MLSNYAMGMAETQNRALFPSQTISGKAAPERALGFVWLGIDRLMRLLRLI